MAEVDSFELKIGGLDKLIKALKSDPPVCRVGILGEDPREKTGAGKSSPTNAEIGAVHEFGSEKRNIKPRSWLRIPLIDNLNHEMEARGLLDKQKLAEVIASKSMVPWFKEVALCAEAVISDAFDTSGDGKWPAWRTPGYTNNAGQLLVDTKQLRESVTSEVRG